MKEQRRTPKTVIKCTVVTKATKISVDLEAVIIFNRHATQPVAVYKRTLLPKPDAFGVISTVFSISYQMISMDFSYSKLTDKPYHVPISNQIPKVSIRVSPK